MIGCHDWQTVDSTLDPTLHDLAGRVGVATGTGIGRGGTSPVARDTVVAVLAALEIDASTPEPTSQPLWRAISASSVDRRCCRPAMTIREHRTATVWVHVPHDAASVAVWIGTLRRGRVVGS
mgnify:CR=1 FL=1